MGDKGWAGCREYLFLAFLAVGGLYPISALFTREVCILLSALLTMGGLYANVIMFMY